MALVLRLALMLAIPYAILGSQGAIDTISGKQRAGWAKPCRKAAAKKVAAGSECRRVRGRVVFMRNVDEGKQVVVLARWRPQVVVVADRMLKRRSAPQTLRMWEATGPVIDGKFSPVYDMRHSYPADGLLSGEIPGLGSLGGSRPAGEPDDGSPVFDLGTVLDLLPGR